MFIFKCFFGLYIYIFSYVRQNFELRMRSFTLIARGNFRTLPVFYLSRSTATIMFGATVSTPLPLLLEVPLRLRLGLRLVPRYRYCLEFRALRLGSLLGLGLPVTAKARSRAMDRSTARSTSTATVRAKVSTATVMFGATVSTPLPLLLEVPLRLRLGLRS